MQIADTLPVISSPHSTPTAETKSDESLVKSIADGDHRAVELLFNRYNVRVYRFALRLTGDVAIAEDVVSNVFIDVWRNAHMFEARSQVSTWLLAIARHKAMTAVKDRREIHLDEGFAATIADEADDPEVVADRASRSAVLRKCLMQLPPSQREIVDLVYYHGKSIVEVAQITGIPAGTVKSRMFTARSRMVRLLREAGVDGAYTN